MNTVQKLSTRLYQSVSFTRIAKMSTGDPGSGAGKGGGTGGSIRDAGGSFGKMEVAHEEEYFYKQRQEQLLALKQKMVDEDTFHEQSIKQHEDAIKRHKEHQKKSKK